MYHSKSTDTILPLNATRFNGKSTPYGKFFIMILVIEPTEMAAAVVSPGKKVTLDLLCYIRLQGRDFCYKVDIE